MSDDAKPSGKWKNKRSGVLFDVHTDGRGTVWCRQVRPNPGDNYTTRAYTVPEFKQRFTYHCP